MGLTLARVGRWAAGHAWQVLIAWSLLLGALLGGGVAAGGQLREAFEIPGTQSQEALDRLASVFPQVAGGSAQVVVVPPEGQSVASGPVRDELEALSEELGAVPGVAQAVSPFNKYATDGVSLDGQAAIIALQFDVPTPEIPDATLEAVKATAPALEAKGYRIEFGGQPFQELEYGITITEALGVLVAGAVLVITLGSVLAAGMPLVTAITGVGVTMGGILLAARFADISQATPMLAVMIGLAVGIDYSLFLVSRHRTELARGARVADAAATATGTAGGAVVFAGLTVMVALLGLIIVGIPFLSVMGIASAIAVLAAMAVAVTLLPALFGLAGERLRPRTRATKRAREPHRMARAWVNGVTAHPILAVLGVVLVLGTIAIPAASLHLALPSAASQPQGTTARDANDLLAEHWGPGQNGPLLVMLDITQASNDTLLQDLDHVRDLVRGIDGVRSTGDALPNPTVDSAILQVNPTTAPDDPRTLETVQRIRALGDTVAQDTGMTLSVTGATAVAIDVSDRLNQALIPFALVVVGISFVLLMMVFRSILVPLKAALSFLLSVLAAFGATVAIFQWGWCADLLGIVPGPIISFMPILLLAIVFGLAMDYEVFLVSGMREAAVAGKTPREAVQHGFVHGSRVVTAAALIMIFVFGAFVPEGAGVIKTIALGLAVGVAADAFLVRMTLVPALMVLFGRFAWRIPRRLAKFLPELDIEGTGLLRQHAAEAWHADQIEGIHIEGVKIGGVSYDGSVPRGGILLVPAEQDDATRFLDVLRGTRSIEHGRLAIHSLAGPAAQHHLREHVALITNAVPHERVVSTSVGNLLALHAELGTGRATALGRDELAAAVSRLERLLVSFGHEVPTPLIEQTMVSLDPLTQALVNAVAALAEGAEVLAIDLGQLIAPRAGNRDADILIDALGMLAPAGVSLVIVARDALLGELAQGPRHGRAVARLVRRSSQSRTTTMYHEEFAS